ncbi:hypothetical protein [Clostridium intestinale]|uniref:hypothetical protein n=1 Tax=Clostridium intestinale TaxID=36845 RepID=UPI0028EBCBE2|nr:hypothetical protein [Clostridium intestinale]
MDNYLFYGKGELSSAIEQRKKEVRDHIESQERNYILNVNEDDFIHYIYNKYFIEPIILHDDSISIVSENEKNIDVSKEIDRFFTDRIKPYYIKGLSITFGIPFEGEVDLFKFRASTISSVLPRGEISKNDLLLTFEGSNLNGEDIKKDLDRQVDSIKKHIAWTNRDVEQFNNNLENLITSIFKTRKEKIKKDLNLVSSLGIPLRKNQTTIDTYVVPTNMKSIKASKPVISEKEFVPEPVIDMKTYDDILNMLNNMVLVMERSPEAFSKMNEESLRQHFLVQLNGTYEGKATGETFNSNGKTDILIREDGKNVFIGECKFWRGDQVYLDTIDQLLGYLCWRDTKAAILIFNRNKEFSNVLAKIEELTKQHKNFKKYIGKQNETQFRYIFNQPNDKNREIILTVLAFDIPKIK